MLGPAFQHVLVGAFSDYVVLRVCPSAKLADAVHRACPDHGQVPTIKVLVIDDLSAGGLYIDRLMEVSAVHPACKDTSAVLPFGGFQGFGTVTIPSDAVFVKKTNYLYEKKIPPLLEKSLISESPSCREVIVLPL